MCSAQMKTRVVNIASHYSISDGIYAMSCEFFKCLALFKSRSQPSSFFKKKLFYLEIFSDGFIVLTKKLIYLNKEMSTASYGADQWHKTCQFSISTFNDVEN